MEFLRLMMNPVFRHSPHRAMRTQVGTLIFVKTRGFYGMYRVSGASTSCDRLWILVSCWDHLPVVTIISKGKEASQIINSFFSFPFPFVFISCHFVFAFGTGKTLVGTANGKNVIENERVVSNPQILALRSRVFEFVSQGRFVALYFGLKITPWL